MELKSSMFVFLLFYLLLSPICSSLQAQSFSPGTLKAERILFKDKVNNEIRNAVTVTLTDSTEKIYHEAFWLAQISLTPNNEVKYLIDKGFDYYQAASPGFRRALIETMYTLFPSEYTNKLEQILGSETNPKLFAMAVTCLTRSGGDRKRFFVLLNKNFPDWKDNPILSSLALHLTGRRYTETPPIEDLLNSALYNDIPVIFSIQRPDRDYPGIALVRLPGTGFVKDSGGNIFYIRQLARSISSLPGYITNGNTPAGIFSVQGKAVSTSNFIGPTENIQMILPFEDSAKVFMHDEKYSGVEMDEDIYASLLPDSWKNNAMIFEAFRAGKAGRSEIIAHGTTIDTSFYSGLKYYPLTPSLGCLCAEEIWSEETGTIISSEQQRLMDVLKDTDLSKGYLIVVETEDLKKPVDISEIGALIKKK